MSIQQPVLDHIPSRPLPKERNDLSHAHYYSFFQNQVVFLTGGTGGLGGCLLYKLVLKLQTKKIYVLCRSIPKAHRSWSNTMPHQYQAILNSGKVVLVEGDITMKNFGVDISTILDATIVINAAADISFAQELDDAIKKNCYPPLELAKMASQLPKLRCFIQFSTAYCNSHLPDGLVEEKIYTIDGADPERELETKENADKFPWPYAYSKHLMEQLLLSRNPDLPILIVRPTIIGTAVHQPYPLYGPIGSTPLESFFKFFSLSPGNRVFHATAGSDSGTNIFDEVPVDWVANLTLLHAAAGTRGIVHAGSESYIPRTLDDMLRVAQVNDADMEVRFVKDRSVEQCPLAAFYKVASRDWRFSNKSSAKFRGVEGPLSISVKGIDLFEFDCQRMHKLNSHIESYRRHSKSKL
ncbi:Fatty acyl-CoA reductase 2 [Golovinomyces cichoracearum]|uniref:Fatty acyl-CoA reductase n=1 Tax=Golovinomyces cichoracearum TaxID=62708 RepID=A0A420I9H3_9PEZI|nr:Fatty acyl-CoA reductase 2 [Golovinomyces cichoracearum]